jgi:hypothetical protein
MQIKFIARIYNNNNFRLTLVPQTKKKLTPIKYVLSYITTRQTISFVSAAIISVSYNNTYNTRFHKMHK